MSVIGIRQAKAQWTRLLSRVGGGDEIVITRRGRPVARLVPVKASGKRRLGIDEGVFNVPDDFDAPLPDDVVESFQGPSRPALRRS
jgi:prevent-host-death family protein